MGRLKLEAWQRIGAPDHLLNWVQHGAIIHFKSEPEACDLANRVHGTQEHNFVDTQIQKLLKEGAIRECKIGERPHCVLPIQCVPKKNKKL